MFTQKSENVHRYNIKRPFDAGGLYIWHEDTLVISYYCFCDLVAMR